MADAPDPRLFPYADHVLDRLDAERDRSAPVRAAVEAGEPLWLDFHAHADGSGWCAAIRSDTEPRDAGQLDSSPRDLVHLRGIVKRREECAPMARVLAGLMTARYRLKQPPRIVLDGRELFV